MSWLQGFGSGILGMFGLGSLYNPLSSVQDQIAAAQQNLLRIMAVNPLQAQKININIQDEMVQVMQSSQKAAAQALQLQTTLIWGEINKQNIVSGAVAMVVLLLLIFLLFVRWLR